MDDTQELEQMKFLGIFSESFKTILKFKKIFAQITITLILPLALTIIAHMSISDRFFKTIEKNPYQFIIGSYDGYRSFYNTQEATPQKWQYYLLFKLNTFLAVKTFSLLSTPAVIQTTASVYTGHLEDVTYSKIMGFVPFSWFRLNSTFVWMYVTLIAYNLIVSVVIFLSNAVVEQNDFIGSIVILHFMGYLYLISVSQIASVVTVLEPSCYGIKAMVKAKDLLNGKKIVTIPISFILHGFLAGVVCMYMTLTVYNDGQLSAFWRLMIGILTGVLLVIAFLLVMVVETVVYLVCKAYHHETVEPVSRLTYLDNWRV